MTNRFIFHRRTGDAPVELVVIKYAGRDQSRHRHFILKQQETVSYNNNNMRSEPVHISDLETTRNCSLQQQQQQKQQYAIYNNCNNHYASNSATGYIKEYVNYQSSSSWIKYSLSLSTIWEKIAFCLPATVWKRLQNLTKLSKIIVLFQSRPSKRVRLNFLPGKTVRLLTLDFLASAWIWCLPQLYRAGAGFNFTTRHNYRC